MRRSKQLCRLVSAICLVALVALPLVLSGCGRKTCGAPYAYGPCYKPSSSSYPALSHNNCRHYMPYRRVSYGAPASYRCCPYYY